MFFKLAFSRNFTYSADWPGYRFQKEGTDPPAKRTLQMAWTLPPEIPFSPCGNSQKLSGFMIRPLRGWGKFGWTDFQNIWSMVHPPFCRKMMKHGVHPTFYQSELIVHEIILQNPLALLQWWPCAIICNAGPSNGRTFPLCSHDIGNSLPQALQKLDLSAPRSRMVS